MHLEHMPTERLEGPATPEQHPFTRMEALYEEAVQKVERIAPSTEHPSANKEGKSKLAYLRALFAAGALFGVSHSALAEQPLASVQDGAPSAQSISLQTAPTQEEQAKNKALASQLGAGIDFISSIPGLARKVPGIGWAAQIKELAQGIQQVNEGKKSVGEFWGDVAASALSSPTLGLSNLINDQIKKAAEGARLERKYAFENMTRDRVEEDLITSMEAENERLEKVEEFQRITQDVGMDEEQHEAEQPPTA